MSNRSCIRILVVDDHDMLREGLAVILKTFGDLEIVGEAASGKEAVVLCQDLLPDVVLMDLVMPGMDGVQATSAIHGDQPEIAIIALSSFGEAELVRDALQAGATSYLLKNVSADKLAEAIRATSSGLPTLSPEIAQRLTDVVTKSSRSCDYDLTARESQVLRLLVDGLTNRQIAIRLEVSEFTVKNHVSAILSKLDVSSRTEAVSMAFRDHLISEI